MKGTMNHLRPENSITFKVHVGPGKTGSSSIQAILDQQRELLAQRGVYVPQGVSKEYPGHHMIPYTLLGRPLANLGSVEVENLAQLFGSWLLDATQKNCRVIVISAEDISLFDETQWRELGQCLMEAQTLSGVQISNLGFYFVAREFEDRLRSAAKEQYKYGAALPLEELMDLIQSTDSPKFELIEKIPEFMPIPSNLNYIPFAGGDLVRRWCDVVLGDEASSHLPESAFGVIVNVAMADSTYEELRKFNVLNTPANLARGFSALAKPETAEDLVALERLKITRWAFAQRDHYYAEMNRLAYQLSQLEKDL